MKAKKTLIVRIGRRADGSVIPGSWRLVSLKDGLTPEQKSAYLARHPEAVEVKSAPCQSKIESWFSDGGCKTVKCGCWVEPDGTCEHGRPAWALVLGYL